MDSKNGFEMNLIVVEAIRGRCESFTVLTATVSEIVGGQTTPSILVDGVVCPPTISIDIPCKEGAQILKLRRVVYRSANVRLYSMSREGAEFQSRR